MFNHWYVPNEALELQSALLASASWTFFALVSWPFQAANADACKDLP